jgi:hypothetical protein
LRCSNDLVFPCRVSIRRRTHLKRMRTVEQDLVGWSTANALVYRAGDGQEAQDDQGLCDLVREWEKSHEP